jgi:hypothetical protein
MTRAIESAIFGSAVRDGEVRTSKAGTDYGILTLSIRDGQDENGKDHFSYVKVMVFNEDILPEVLKIKKSDWVYCEGALEAKIWDSDKGARLDLSLRAFYLRRAGIGKDRPKREDAPPAGDREPYRRQAPPVQGRDDRRYEFDDELSF